MSPGRSSAASPEPDADARQAAGGVLDRQVPASRHQSRTIHADGITTFIGLAEIHIAGEFSGRKPRVEFLDARKAAPLVRDSPIDLADGPVGRRTEIPSPSRPRKMFCAPAVHSWLAYCSAMAIASPRLTGGYPADRSSNDSPHPANEKKIRRYNRRDQRYSIEALLFHPVVIVRISISSVCPARRTISVSKDNDNSLPLMALNEGLSVEFLRTDRYRRSNAALDTGRPWRYRLCRRRNVRNRSEPQRRWMTIDCLPPWRFWLKVPQPSAVVNAARKFSGVSRGAKARNPVGPWYR